MRALALAACLCAAPPAMAQQESSERVVAALSQSRVAITATFSGSEIFVYGAVERDRFPDARDDALDVVIAITGPSAPVVVRRKDRVLGVWANAERLKLDSAPSFYAVATSGPLDEILGHTDDLRHRIRIETAVREIGGAGKVADPDAYREALIRLRTDRGVYFENIGGVEIIDRTLFQARIGLPANIVEGDYQARVFLLRDKKVLDSFESVIKVRKVGLERWVYTLAHQRPFVYGVASIALALFAGWAASAVFRLARR